MANVPTAELKGSTVTAFRKSAHKLGRNANHDRRRRHIQGDNSGPKQPPVELVQTILAVGGLLL